MKCKQKYFQLEPRQTEPNQAKPSSNRENQRPKTKWKGKSRKYLGRWTASERVSRWKGEQVSGMQMQLGSASGSGNRGALTLSPACCRLLGGSDVRPVSWPTKCCQPDGFPILAKGKKQKASKYRQDNPAHTTCLIYAKSLGLLRLLFGRRVD